MGPVQECQSSLTPHPNAEAPKPMGADILMEPEILMFSYGLREVGACEIGAESGVPEASFHFFGYCIITSKVLVTICDQKF